MTEPRRTQHGQALLEVVILTPVLLGLFMLIVYAAQLPAAQSRLDDAAQTAARAATTAHTATDATLAARTTATRALAGSDCHDPTITVDTIAFRPGGSVTVTIACVVSNQVLGLPGLGNRHLTASFASPVDLAATANP